MTNILRATGLALLALGLLLWAPGVQAQVSQSVQQSITQTGGDPQALSAAITSAIAGNPGQAAEIAAFAASQFPGQAADIAAAAAAADPTAAAAIVVAVILALPADQQEKNAPAIVAAVEDAVPGSTDQITTAITNLAFARGGADPDTRGQGGAPLWINWTDPRHASPT